MRKGTLTDKATLKLYETGTPIIVLCMHEGMTAHGMIGRISRARRARTERHPVYWANRRPTKLPSRPVETFGGLKAAIRQLELQGRS